MTMKFEIALNKLKNSKFFREQVINESVLAVYAGGSLLLGTEDSNSDVDFMIITKGDNKIEHFTYSFEIDGVDLHGYIASFRHLLTSHKTRNKLVCLGGMQLSQWRKEVILYSSPKFFEFMENMKMFISLIASYKYIENNTDYIGQMTDYKFFIKNYSKIFYMVELANSIIQNKEIDRNFIREVKRSTINNLSEANKIRIARSAEKALSIPSIDHSALWNTVLKAYEEYENNL